MLDAVYRTYMWLWIYAWFIFACMCFVSVSVSCSRIVCFYLVCYLWKQRIVHCFLTCVSDCDVIWCVSESVCIPHSHIVFNNGKCSKLKKKCARFLSVYSPVADTENRKHFQLKLRREVLKTHCVCASVCMCAYVRAHTLVLVCVCVYHWQWRSSARIEIDPNRLCVCVCVCAREWMMCHMYGDIRCLERLSLRHQENSSVGWTLPIEKLQKHVMRITPRRQNAKMYNTHICVGT